jgi:hypothetical protein
MSIFVEWPHNWFGLWKAEEADPPQVPLFADVVDVTWGPTDLGDIVRYLQKCPVALASGVRPEKCPFCEDLLTEPGTQRSDGLWVWPSSLAHYVSRHHVRLPDRMVEHIRSRGYTPPPYPPPVGVGSV